MIGALDGLDDAQLRRAVLPSGWSSIELVRHLTISDEHYWFAHAVGGAEREWPPGDRGDWTVGDDETPTDVLAAYRAAIEQSDAVLAATTMDAAPRRPDPEWEQWGMAFPTVRHVVAHVLTETAVHVGHLDAVRELLDGRQWLVMDG